VKQCDPDFMQERGRERETILEQKASEKSAANLTHRAHCCDGAVLRNRNLISRT
jgi:hypothetical protein